LSGPPLANFVNMETLSNTKVAKFLSTSVYLEYAFC
jgi:hypothetical protein